MTLLAVAWVMFKYAALYGAVVLTLSYAIYANITPNEEKK